MYGFWLTVIVYSMCILVLVYTYQFEHFDVYWEEYLKIPHELYVFTFRKFLDYACLYAFSLKPESVDSIPRLGNFFRLAQSTNFYLR